jgi:sec-independent protein translocase protein TatB
MLNGLGWEELLLLAIIGLVVFGPERLPKAAQDLGRLLRQFRTMARGAASDLKAELGPEMADVSLRSMHPRRFVEDALFGDDEPATMAGNASKTMGQPVGAGLEAGQRPPYDSDAT